MSVANQGKFVNFSQLKPTIERQYVTLMMDVIARGLVTASQVDEEIQQELKGFPVGMVFCMQVYPSTPKFMLKVLPNQKLIKLNNTDVTADLTITFKHLQHAFLVFSFQESTAQAFANDRMIADGDLSYAIRWVRCLNKMEALILPKMLANLAIKSYPTQLTLKDKLKKSSSIYLKMVQSYFK
ncbi:MULTISPECIES: hypothetical protein [unclassified Acinetobacter]|uniref:hypothetical protein n=1 Tax=unclassified Acinetobacter TaxID=196816 RepID=UPI0035B802A0